MAAAVAPLPIAFDFSCPVALPERPPLVEWPWPIAGPSTDGDAASFFRRRYIETLYVGEPVFPLSGLAADLERLGASLPALLPSYFLDLSAIEARHRQQLMPILKAAVAGTETAEALGEAALESDEAQTLLAGVELRLKSRAAAEGERVVTAKALAEELEQREVLIQLLFLLHKRRGERSQGQAGSDTQLELLSDRMGVWQAVAELGIGLDLDPGPSTTPANAGEERGVSALLKKYWDRALVPHFIATEATFLGSFHHKVFGTAMPPELLPVKKPRKPKVTRRLSVEERPPLSRGSSSRKREREEPKERRESAGRERRRSEAPVLEESEGSRQFRRSTSVMSSRSERSVETSKRIVRAPSGRDIFKGREIGVLKRTSSLQRSTSELKVSGPSAGLLGRRVEVSSQSLPSTSLTRTQSQSHAQMQLREYRRVQSQQSRSETLVYATPSKPKSNLFAFAGHPTPIREEPSSGARASVVEETPHANRVAETPTSRRIAPTFIAETPSLGRIAETPTAERTHTTPLSRRYVAETPVGRYVAETPSRSRRRCTPLSPRRSTGSDDELAGLMVPTDDEDEPPTPRRSLSLHH